MFLKTDYKIKNVAKTRTAFPERQECVGKQRDLLIGCCIRCSMEQIVWPPKYADFGHWRHPNEHLGHL